MKKWVDFFNEQVYSISIHNSDNAEWGCGRAWLKCLFAMKEKDSLRSIIF